MRAWVWLTLSAIALSGCQKSTPVGGGEGGAGGAAPAGDANTPIVLATPAPVIIPAPVVNAQAYLAKASASNLFEIETSRAILKTTQKPDIRDYAQRVIRAHDDATQMVARAAQDAGMPPPVPHLPSDRQQQLDAIKGASGIDADHLYIDDQRSATVEALAIHKSYGADGDNSHLRAAAGRIAAMVQLHIDALGRVKRD